jgi:hypothetical protein
MSKHPDYRKRRGRPRALSMGGALTASQRQLDDLLGDIIRTTHRHPVIDSVRELTALLRDEFPDEYGHRQPDTFRKDVAKVMHWAASRLYRLRLAKDDLMAGFDEATGLFDEAVVNKAAAAAQVRLLHMSRDQLQGTLQRLRELPDPDE